MKDPTTSKAPAPTPATAPSMRRTTATGPAPIALLAAVDLAVPFGYQWFPVVKPDSTRVPEVQRT